MVRKKEERLYEVRPHLYDGEGEVEITHILNTPEEMNGKGRMFATVKLAPGASLGYHVHEKDSETYYIISGTGEYNDNNEKTVIVGPGDVTCTLVGGGHSFKNTGDEPLEFVAVILYE